MRLPSFALFSPSTRNEGFAGERSGAMRKDLDLKREILAELDYEPSVNSRALDVSVKEGVVTLSGVVDSYAEKFAAETAAKRIQGVQAVAMDVEVRVPTLQRHSDVDIARAAVTALEWNVLVPKDRLQVKVENGWLTLDGEVGWDYQRTAAACAVRNLAGVRGLTNAILLTPKAATEPIREQILGALRRSAQLDARSVQVAAVDGRVTLTGRVSSWMARGEAERLAWAASGVSQVENRLVVAA
jgi:osmotically-inducible protein OsmY